MKKFFENLHIAAYFGAVIMVFIAGAGILSYTLIAGTTYHEVVGTNLSVMEMIKSGASTDRIKEELSLAESPIQVEINGVNIHSKEAVSLKKDKNEVAAYASYDWDYLFGLIELEDQISYSKQIQ